MFVLLPAFNDLFYGHRPYVCFEMMVGHGYIYVLLGLWRKDERVGIPHLLRCIKVFISML